jgi:hypothetical protein
MEDEKQHIEALQDIRKMMKESSRFLSLSGLSGVFAGAYALLGAWAANRVMIAARAEEGYGTSQEDAVYKCALIALGTLFLSLATAILLSAKKASRNGHKLFDHTAYRLMINMLIPLLAGGIFCVALLSNTNTVMLVAPAMLIFYGLALVNGSKYTMSDIRYLGCAEIALGLVCAFFPGYGLLFWALGFGVLHVTYGAYMWLKYDRN